MCQIAVADFATAYAALCLGFAGREGREVIVQEETLGTLVENVVHHLFVEFCTEGNGGEALSLATGENGASVRTGQIIYLTPDRADVGSLAAVQTDAFVEYAAAHGLALYVVVVALHHSLFFLAFFLGDGFDVFLADSVEAILTPVLVGAAGFGNGVSLVVAFCVNVGTESLVVHLVAVFALNSGTNSFGQFHLNLALCLDSVVGGTEGSEQVGFAHLVHLAFHHHDVVVGGANHQFHVGFLKLVESGVDNEFTVDACNTHFGDRTVEGNIADSESSRSGKAGQTVGSVNAIGGEKDDIYKSVGVIIVGEQGTQHAVDQTGRKDFIVAGAAFAF